MMLIGIVPVSSSFGFNLDIKTEKDPYAVFYPAKTYSWHPLSAVYHKYDAPIRAALDRELAAKGFTKIDSGSPDFWVGYQFSRVEKTQKVVNRESRGEYSWDEKVHREGTLRVDIFSPDQRRIIWKGWSESVYSPDLSEKKKIEMSDEAIHLIISQLPPPG